MTDQPSPASRREVLAFIALQDLPMPQLVNFYSDGNGFGLTFDSHADMEAWAEPLGATLRGERLRFAESSTGRPMTAASGHGSWHGRSVGLNSYEYADVVIVDELDEDTVSKLQEIAGGDDQ